MCNTFFVFLTGPPTPTSVNVSMAMNRSLAGLFVSWDAHQGAYGSIQYHVISDQNLTCNSTSSSCTLWAAGCGETHSIQVTASNKAGPSQPSSPVIFITCECKRNLIGYLLTTNHDWYCIVHWWQFLLCLFRPLPSRIIRAGGVITRKLHT